MTHRRDALPESGSCHAWGESDFLCHDELLPNPLTLGHTGEDNYDCFYFGFRDGGDDDSFCFGLTGEDDNDSLCFGFTGERLHIGDGWTRSSDAHVATYADDVLTIGNPQDTDFLAQYVYDNGEELVPFYECGCRNPNIVFKYCPVHSPDAYFALVRRIAAEKAPGAEEPEITGPRDQDAYSAEPYVDEDRFLIYRTCIDSDGTEYPRLEAHLEGCSREMADRIVEAMSSLEKDELTTMRLRRRRSRRRVNAPARRAVMKVIPQINGRGK
jgi:hypothetical protein